MNGELGRGVVYGFVYGCWYVGLCVGLRIKSGVDD